MHPRPLSRWHGGKWKLAPQLLEHFPPHDVYVEPFAGPASVLLRKSRVKTEVYTDLDENLYELFSILQDDEQAKELCRRCELTLFSRKEFNQSYEYSSNKIERARRFIVRSFFGFGSKCCTTEKQNGLRCFRYNKNSPAVDWTRYPPVLAAISQRMRGVAIEASSALNVIERFDRPNTLFYLDPPYPHESRNLKMGQYHHEMNDTGHEKLARKLQTIKGMAIISGCDTDLYRRLYAGWQIKSKTHYADMASKRKECIRISPRAVLKNQLRLKVTYD